MGQNGTICEAKQADRTVGFSVLGAWCNHKWRYEKYEKYTGPPAGT